MTAIDQDKDLASGDTASTVADKNFIESLKDAMRTGFLLFYKKSFKNIFSRQPSRNGKRTPQSTWMAGYLLWSTFEKGSFFSIL